MEMGPREKFTERLVAYVTPAQKERVTALAAAKNRSAAEVVRHIIDRYFGEQAADV